MGKKIFVFVVFVIVVCGLVFGKMPETNLLKAVLPQNQSVLIKASDKFSSAVNVVFEAEDSFEAEILKDDFLNDFGVDKVSHFEFENLLSEYNSARSNFLSEKSRKQLLDKRYDDVFKNSRQFLYNPANVIVSEPKDDPFMLFSDFVSNLLQKEVRYSTDFGGNGYAVLNLNNLQKSDINQLFELQKKYSVDEKKVYLTGSPVHSFYTSERSANEINVIALFSAIFVLTLTYYYFRNFKVLIPIIASILAGIGIGYCLTALIFKNVHVLTFVFSTTLIGICVDYSLHWFVEKDKEKLFQSLTDSLVTTVAAFALLIFANIPLLGQIAVFTATGLISVFFIVKYFYSGLEFDFPQKNKFPRLKIKYKKIILVLFAVFIAFGLARVKFTDDITTLYKPSVELALGERILNDISLDKSRTIVSVTGENIQKILEKEEQVKDTVNAKFVALSDFVPSIKRQNSNRELIEKLYDKKLNSCSDILSSEQIRHLSGDLPQKEILPNFEKNTFLKNFMLDEKTSVMVVNKDIEVDLKIDGASVINIAKDVSSQLEKHRKTCVQLVFGAFLMLLGYLYLRYENGAFKIILPSICGILTSFAALGLTMQPVNLFHIFAMFLILGFTLDYSIFRISKIKNSADAVLISCLTTAFSFFLLTFTSFKLISSLGFVLSVGIFSSYLFSLILIDGGNDEVV